MGAGMTLKVENLHYSILDNVNLSFEPGKLYGIIGPNGSGKTTFLKCLCAIWKPLQGRITFDGCSLLDLDRQVLSKIITYVPQNTTLYFDFTVEEFVQMACAQPAIDQYLEEVHISHLKHRFVNQLSSGEKQRVYIARALATEAPILLLDEPTSSLDIKHQWEIWELIKRLSHQGKTLIMSTHDMKACLAYCEEITLFEAGKCVIHGHCDQILHSSDFKKVFNLSQDLFLHLFFR